MKFEEESSYLHNLTVVNLATDLMVLSFLLSMDTYFSGK